MLMQSYPVLSWHILTQTKRPALHMRWRPEARAGGTPDQPCSCFSTTLVCSSAWRNLRSANVKSQKARLDLDIYIYIYIFINVLYMILYTIYVYVYLSLSKFQFIVWFVCVLLLCSNLEGQSPRIGNHYICHGSAMAWRTSMVSPI